jgi:hypothetical protein
MEAIHVQSKNCVGSNNKSLRNSTAQEKYRFVFIHMKSTGYFCGLERCVNEAEVDDRERMVP